MQKLTIIDGPDDGPFDDIINSDDASREVAFITKEKGIVKIQCNFVSVNGPLHGVGHDILITNDYCSIDYDSVKKVGTINFTDTRAFK